MKEKKPWLWVGLTCAIGISVAVAITANAGDELRGPLDRKALIHNSFSHLTFEDNVGTADVVDMAEAFSIIMLAPALTPETQNPETLSVTFFHGDKKLDVEFVREGASAYHYVGGLQAILPFFVGIEGNEPVYFTVEGDHHTLLAIDGKNVLLPVTPIFGEQP